MSRVVLAAALLFAVHVPADAQRGMRGFSGGRVAVGRPAPSTGFARAPRMFPQTFASRPAFMARPRAVLTPQRRFASASTHAYAGRSYTSRGYRGDSDHDRDRDHDVRFHRRHLHYAFPYYYGYAPLYYGDYWDPYYSAGSYSYDTAANTGNYSDLSNQVGQLDAEVRELRDENDSLRESLDQRYRPTASAKPALPPANEPATVLVFRDGHRAEVKNYAIIGSTLWLLSDTRATKVPLSDLNLDQTVKVNEDRGVDFALPK